MTKLYQLLLLMGTLTAVAATNQPHILSTNLTVATRLTAPPPAENAGDYYLLPGNKQIPLLRLKNETAVCFLNDHPAATRSLRQIKFPGKTRVDILTSATINTQAVRYAFPIFLDPKTKTRLIPTDEILVRLATGVQLSTLTNDLATAGLTVIQPTGPLSQNTYRLRLTNPKTANPLAIARQLATHNKLRWAAPNFIREIQLFATPDDPLFNLQQSLHNTGQNGAVPGADIHAPATWDITTGTNVITIAIIDDGVDTNHTDLVFAPGGTNFVDNTGDPSPVNANGHGTACAGIAAATINNSNLVAGIAGGCRILAISIVDTNGTFTTDDIIGNAITYAADHADILSDSWGGGSESPYINDAIDYAATAGRGGKGCPVFFASGNSASSWYHGGSRMRIGMGGFSGDYYVAFYYGNNGSSNGEETVRIDNFCLLSPDGDTHLTGVIPDEDFEGFAPGWWLYGDAGWTLSLDNAFTGTGGFLSAASPSLTNGQAAWLLSPLIHFNGDETIAFANSTSIATNSNFYLLLYDTNYTYVAGADLGSGVPDITTAVSYPASHTNAIAVGAATDCDRRSDYSEYEGKLDFLAPSNGGWNDIPALDPAGPVGWTSTDYKMNFGGTSAACPLAAGLAALILTANPDLTATQVRDILRNTCDQIGGVPYDAGTNTFYGFGRLNAYRALTNALPDFIGDGIPAWWRWEYFGPDGRTTNSQTAAAADPDADGFTNLQEYLAGTDPRATLSALRITAITHTNPTGTAIAFTTATNHHYRLQYTADLTTGQWTNLTEVPGTGYPLVIPDPGATNIHSRFYRVELVPTP